MCKDFAPNLGDKELVVASQQRAVSHFLFRQGIFVQKQHACHPPPSLHFSVSSIDDKTGRLPF
jgi:hypothetical protein